MDDEIPLQRWLAARVLTRIGATRTTQAELAERCGVTAAYMSQLLNGRREGSLSMWDRILREAGCPLVDYSGSMTRPEHRELEDPGLYDIAREITEEFFGPGSWRDPRGHRRD